MNVREFRERIQKEAAEITARGNPRMSAIERSMSVGRLHFAIGCAQDQLSYEKSPREKQIYRIAAEELDLLVEGYGRSFAPAVANPIMQTILADTGNAKGFIASVMNIDGVGTILRHESKHNHHGDKPLGPTALKIIREKIRREFDPLGQGSGRA